MLINHRRFWDQEPPKEEFAYTVEEVAFTHGGVEYFADVTYSLFVGWEYDSGDPDVGIHGGWIARHVDQDVVAIRLYDEDGNLLDESSDDFVAEVVKSVPKLTGHCLDHALGR